MFPIPLLLIPESLQLLDDDIEVVGEGQLEVLVFPKFHHFLQERIYRHLLGPEIGAEEDHRTGIAERQVVVLYGILEDLLHSARTTRSIDDATEGNGEDQVLADAVLEELGDMGSKRSGGLVTIEIGGDAEAT